MTIEQIVKQGDSLFSKSPERLHPIQEFTNLQIVTADDQKVFLEPAIIKSDHFLSELILQLENSDWVKQGTKYLDKTETCPFCQQEINASLKSEIANFFDDNYEKTVLKIERHKEEFINRWGVVRKIF